MSVVAICQPNFLPWLGYFEMADRADTFVMLDDVQYVRREWVNRNRILSSAEQGWMWLNVPLRQAPRGTLICDMEIDREKPWAQSILGSLRTIYARAPYFEAHYAGIAEVLERPWRKLVDLNVEVIRHLACELGLRANLLRASSLGTDSRRDDKLADICQALGASVYLANNGSKSYIDPAKFRRRGIGFVFQDYEHPQYAVQGYAFQTFMSVVDLLFWHGPAASEIVLQGRPRAWRSEHSNSSLSQAPAAVVSP